MGHASLAMTMRYVHMSPEHLRGEMVKTERSAGVEPNAGTRVGESGQNASEVIEFTDERRGSSVAEQLIRNWGRQRCRPRRLSAHFHVTL